MVASNLHPPPQPDQNPKQKRRAMGSSRTTFGAGEYPVSGTQIKSIKLRKYYS